MLILSLLYHECKVSASRTQRACSMLRRSLISQYDLITLQRYGEIRIPKIAQMGHSAYHNRGILQNAPIINKVKESYQQRRSQSVTELPSVGN